MYTVLLTTLNGFVTQCQHDFMGTHTLYFYINRISVLAGVYGTMYTVLFTTLFGFATQYYHPKVINVSFSSSNTQNSRVGGWIFILFFISWIAQLA